jgi:two-component system phosphate regulon sensor histidine kinase PhoR
MNIDPVVNAVGQQLEHGIVVVDAGGVVLYANRAARDLMSLAQDCEGRRLADACRDYRLVRAAASCLETENVIRRELPDMRLERKLIMSAVPVRQDGSLLACILIRDESRVLRLEAMRRDFVANVSHELRTPLTAIQLLVETLQRGALRDGDDTREFVGKIGLEVHHMVQMVEELLELSTIESGQRPLDFVDAPIDDVLGGIERLRPLARERAVTLDVEVDEDLPHLSADAPRLSQAIRNLVHNALKFTPPGGSVTVRVSLAGGKSAMRIQVIDTGVGIDPGDLPRIFERFWKADRSRGRDGEGSGLGLAIARHIVEGHGGRITAESEPRKGATFTVNLPLAGPAARRSRPRPDRATAPP